MIDNEYNAYDICINDCNERYIVIYKVTLEREEREFYYHKNLISAIISKNLESDIKKLRNMGFYSLDDFGFERSQIDSDSIIVDFFLASKKNRIMALEKIYFPEVIDDMSYLVGILHLIDIKTGKEYIARTKNFGLESNQLIEIIEASGYKHISLSSFKEKFENLNCKFIRKLKA